jgi:hypothetical protein
MVFTVLPFAEEYQMIDTGLGEDTVRQDCDEARPWKSAKLLIRPAMVGQAGVGDTTTDPQRGHHHEGGSVGCFGSVVVTGTDTGTPAPRSPGGLHRESHSGVSG